MINREYLNDKVSTQIKRVYKNSKQRMIKLDNFFDLNYYNELKEKLKKLNFERNKIPDKFSFSELKNNSSIDTEELEYFINEITVSKGEINIKINKYCWKDYKLIHDSENFSGLKFCIFIIPEELWNQNTGGSFVFRSKEDYVFNPSPNSFFIIEKNREMRDFVQYINNKAGKKFFYVIEGKIF